MQISMGRCAPAIIYFVSCSVFFMALKLGIILRTLHLCSHCFRLCWMILLKTQWDASFTATTVSEDQSPFRATHLGQDLLVSSLEMQAIKWWLNKKSRIFHKNEGPSTNINPAWQPWYVDCGILWTLAQTSIFIVADGHWQEAMPCVIQAAAGKSVDAQGDSSPMSGPNPGYCFVVQCAKTMINLPSGPQVSARGGVGWGGAITFMSTCTHTSCYVMVILGWGGVGWGGAITFMSTCTHMSCYVMVILGWGGVGWGNNVHVNLHTHTHVMLRYGYLGVGWGGVWQYRSCQLAHTRHATLWLSWGGVGWGGAITFMSTCTHTSCYVMVILGWGGVGQ